jgi:cytochrome c oxidase subunit 5a
MTTPLPSGYSKVISIVTTNLGISAWIPIQCSNQADVTFSQSTGIKAKVENKGQYDEYVKELQSIREELGVNLKENLFPENTNA